MSEESKLVEQEVLVDGVVLSKKALKKLEQDKAKAEKKAQIGIQIKIYFQLNSISKLKQQRWIYWQLTMEIMSLFNRLK